MAGGIFGRNRDKNQPVRNSSGTRDHKIDTLYRRVRNNWRVISQKIERISHETRPFFQNFKTQRWLETSFSKLKCCVLRKYVYVG